MSIRSAIAALASFIYPPRCEVCSIPLVAPHSELCPWCELPPLRWENACGRCDEPGASLCAACTEAPILSGRVFTAGDYDGVGELAIKAFKYKARRRLGRVLAQRMLDRLSPHSKHWHLIVPIPSSPASLASRGFHHTLQLANIVGKTLRLPVARSILYFRTSPVPQASLLPDARWENIRDTLHARRRIAGRILLIDDVLTTGATLAEAGRVLQLAGAEAVDAITLLRSTRCLNYRLARAGLAPKQRSIA